MNMIFPPVVHSQMSVAVRASSSETKEPGTLSRAPIWVAGAQVLELSPAAPRMHTRNLDQERSWD